jgi:hypothetical protein
MSAGKDTPSLGNILRNSSVADQGRKATAVNTFLTDYFTAKFKYTVVCKTYFKPAIQFKHIML